MHHYRGVHNDRRNNKSTRDDTGVISLNLLSFEQGVYQLSTLGVQDSIIVVCQLSTFGVQDMKIVACGFSWSERVCLFCMSA